MSIEGDIRSIFQEEIEGLKKHISEIIGRNNPNEERRYLTRKQVSVYLGIGVSTVDFWAKTKRLTKLNVNGSVRFDKAEIDLAIQKTFLTKFKKI
jgi:excisionase family DNA binding protein